MLGTKEETLILRTTHILVLLLRGSFIVEAGGHYWILSVLMLKGWTDNVNLKPR